MKIKFSKYWIASKQQRKQRKYAANAPLHIKRKFLSTNLSKDLRKRYGKRNLPIKKGDLVRIMRGKFKKKQGKVLNVKTNYGKVYVEDIQAKKRDGSKVNIPLRTSNLQIIELNMDSKRVIEEKKKSQSKEENSGKEENKEKNK